MPKVHEEWLGSRGKKQAKAFMLPGFREYWGVHLERTINLIYFTFDCDFIAKGPR